MGPSCRGRDVTVPSFAPDSPSSLTPQPGEVPTWGQSWPPHKARYLHRHTLYRKLKETLNPFNAYLVEIPTALWTEPELLAVPPPLSRPAFFPDPPQPQQLRPAVSPAAKWWSSWAGEWRRRSPAACEIRFFFISLHGKGRYCSQSTLLGMFGFPTLVWTGVKTDFLK